MSETKRMEAAITARARDFEVPALLRALRAAGYSDDAIDLRSNPSLGFSASLVESVEFVDPPASGAPAPLRALERGPVRGAERGPVRGPDRGAERGPERGTGRRAVITLNRGLLSNQGPLPSYFLELLAEQRESLMCQFLWLFDDRLLRAYYLSREPERNRTLLSDVGQMLGDLLRLLRLSSPHGLHWLFQAVFPEVEVHVQRSSSTRTLEVTRTRVAASELGAGSALLGYSSIPAGGMIVTLFANESRTPQGKLWGDEAAERLRRYILPQLRGTELLMTVIVSVRDHYEHIILSPERHLAYGVLYAGSGPRDTAPMHRIVVFHGAVDGAEHASLP